MTFKTLFWRSLLIASVISLCFIAFNVYQDEYGLFGKAPDKPHRIWHNDRSSKYLYSFNYIPKNFDAVLMGPSVSAEIDVKRLRGLKTYNISLGGGNVTELKALADNILQRGHLKAFMICLYPYMTKDHGCKTAYIHPQVFWGALGSRELMNHYVNKILIQQGWRKGLEINEYGSLKAGRAGRNDPETVPDPPTRIPRGTEDLYSIDEEAYRELAEFIGAIRTKHTIIFAYYHPIWIKAFDERRFMNYKTKMDRLFGRDDVIWDMNTEEWQSVRSDPRNYNSTGHLTERGADLVLKSIQDKVAPYFP